MYSPLVEERKGQLRSSVWLCAIIGELISHS
jgi:hypothetical protein